MHRKDIIEKIHSDADLFSMPQVISELLKATELDDLSTNVLSRIIQKDPSITGKVLRLANSPIYRRAAAISDVNKAISVLGTTTVRCLALSSSLFNSKRISASSGVNYKDFFVYIVTTASASELVAQSIGYRAPEEALIAGLLHDIGIIFFLHHYAADYRQVSDLMDNGIPIYKAEQKVFGIDHTEIGFYIAKLWNLPGNIVQAIHKHHEIHDLVNDDDTLTGIVKLGVLMTFNRFSGIHKNIEERLVKIEEVAKSIGLEYEKIADISNSLVSRMVEIASSINAEVEDVESLLTKANRQIWNSYLTINRLFKEREELSRQLLTNERNKAAIEAKDKALATLSHYLNNAVMVISGQLQLLNMYRNEGQTDKLLNHFESSFTKVNDSIFRILAVMEELREISPLDHTEFFSKSDAMNIDSRIDQRIKRIVAEHNIGLPV